MSINEITRTSSVFHYFQMSHADKSSHMLPETYERNNVFLQLCTIYAAYTLSSHRQNVELRIKEFIRERDNYLELENKFQ